MVLQLGKTLCASRAVVPRRARRRSHTSAAGIFILPLIRVWEGGGSFFLGLFCKKLVKPSRWTLTAATLPQGLRFKRQCRLFKSKREPTNFRVRSYLRSFLPPQLSVDLGFSRNHMVKRDK